LPVPLAPLVTVSHAALLDAVHAQPPPALTFTDPVLAVAGTLSVVAERAYPQEPVCVTVMVVPAMVSVPVRLEVAVFAAIENAIVPLPVPDTPLVIVSHAAFEVAVQAQPLPAVTETDDEPPAAPTDALVGETDGLQTPAWVTVKVIPAIVIVPVRGEVLVLAATE
jgi:hypothetical protein